MSHRYLEGMRYTNNVSNCTCDMCNGENTLSGHYITFTHQMNDCVLICKDCIDKAYDKINTGILKEMNNGN